MYMYFIVGASCALAGFITGMNIARNLARNVAKTMLSIRFLIKRGHYESAQEQLKDTAEVIIDRYGV